MRHPARGDLITGGDGTVWIVTYSDPTRRILYVTDSANRRIGSGDGDVREWHY